MKYVIASDLIGIEQALCGFAPLSHRDLADLLLAKFGTGARIVSAGFVEFHDDKAFVFGESDSLGLRPRANDGAFLTAFYRATLRMAREATQSPAVRELLASADAVPTEPGAPFDEQLPVHRHD